MSVQRKKALKDGGAEALIELAKLVPGVGILVEGVRKYHESIEDQQREQFVAHMVDRIDQLEQQSDWFKSDEAREFVTKVVATSLNAEYADKLDYLANALVNGPALGTDKACRLKFLEMIRQISKPALNVLAASLEVAGEGAQPSGVPTGTGEAMAGRIAKRLGWAPELVDACVRELHSLGAFSSVMEWHEDKDEFTPQQYWSQGQCSPTSLTREFVRFISRDAT